MTLLTHRLTDRERTITVEFVANLNQQRESLRATRSQEQLSLQMSKYKRDSKPFRHIAAGLKDEEWALVITQIQEDYP